MEERVIDIYSKGDYPANVLSNFYPNEFIINGVRCGGMEGFLQSLKFRQRGRQEAVAALSGKEAKARGGRKFLWKLTGNVYWQGKRIKRRSEEFLALVTRAYKEMARQSETFREALAASGDATLTHSIGKHDKRRTVLTEEEFIYCLESLRGTDLLLG